MEQKIGGDNTSVTTDARPIRAINNFLRISVVALLENDEVVATDKHDGTSGKDRHNVICKLTLPKVTLGAPPPNALV